MSKDKRHGPGKEQIKLIMYKTGQIQYFPLLDPIKRVNTFQITGSDNIPQTLHPCCEKLQVKSPISKRLI